MKNHTLREVLRNFVSDMVSVEEQALVQMVSAPDKAGAYSLSENYRKHREETEFHARRMGERLKDLGGNPPAVKEAVKKTGGKGFLLFARIQHDTPAKLHTHAYAYAAMAWAGYDMLIQLAQQAGDVQTMELAQCIQRDEQAMMDRLEAGFGEAFTASHPGADREELQKKIPACLADAHALANQSIRLLQKSIKGAPTPEIAKIYQDQLVVSKGQVKLIKQRLRQLETGPSFFKGNVLAKGALNRKQFYAAQSGTPFKCAVVVYALKYLEIGGFEMLRRTAERAGDESTALLCEKLLLEEKGLAGRLRESLPRSVDATVMRDFK